MNKPIIAIIILFLVVLAGCQASGPGKLETTLATEAKKITIGGKELTNPAPDTQASIDEGRGHFQHHCGICHGNDGHATGVPFKDKMSPPVVDLGDKDVQGYADGQLKWIVQNGIRFSGMPGWNGILEDDEMWKIVRFLRHLPEPGKAGIPEIYKEEAEEHEHMKAGEKAAPHTHTHPPGTPPHKH